MRLLSRRSAVFLFLVITGVPIALLMYASIAISTGSAVHQAEKGAADSAQASAVFIHQRLQAVAGQLDSFAQRSLAPAMDQRGPGGYDLGTVAVRLGELTGLQSGIGTAFVTDPRGRLVAIAPQRSDLLGLYFTGDDWYRGVSSHDTPYVAGLSPTGAQQDLSTVAIAAAIHGPAGSSTSRLGYLVGLFGLDQVQAFVDDFARTHGTDLSIVDGDGYVLAAPGLAPGSVTSWPTDDRLLRSALAGRAGVSQVTRAGVEHLAAYASVPGIHWAVVADVPAAVALSDAAQLRATVLATAGVLGVVLIAGLVVGQTLVHRAQQSAVFQQRMEALGRLNEAARSVHAEHGPRALKIIATSARELVVADFSALGVWNAAEERMEPAAHDASPGLPAEGLDDLAKLLVEHRQPATVNGCGDLRDASGVEAGAGPWVGGPVLSVPVNAGDRVLGCLVACRRQGSAEFHAVNEGQLQQMAQHATSVLEKARHDAEREAFLQRLSETNEELQRASRLKSQFLARMSHELRTPLAAIIGFSDLLLEGTAGELGAEQREDVQQIASAGRVLLDVINDILDLSRIEAGRMRLEVRRIRLRTLLDDVVSALRPLAREKALELRVEVAGGDQPVMADPLRVRQVVTNLVSNALKFTQRGGVTVRLQTLAEEVEVSVHDTGVGIPHEALDSVFDEFTQLDSRTRPEPAGSGLGLSIARGLVHLHGGSIGVESEVGAGSRFWFRLPAARRAPGRRPLRSLPAGEGVAR
jgi:signal transduction histidine kinase